LIKANTHSLKNLSVLAFLLLAASLSSYSQTEWAPIGAKWANEHDDVWMGVFYHFTFESTKDTVVQTKNCKKIDIYESVNNKANQRKYSFYNGFYLMYSDSSKVYYMHNDTFRLLYDFSLEKGDTFYSFQTYDRDTNKSIRKYIIDSVNTIQISGKQLKRQYLHNIDLDPDLHLSYRYIFRDGEIIERIGFNGFMFGSNRNWMSDDFGPGLKCYHDIDLFYKRYSEANCDGLDGINEADKSEVLKLYPNPVNDELVVNYTGNKLYNIEIINSLGIKMMGQNNLSSASNSLNVKSLKPGVYFLIIKNDKTSLVKKFLKQ
jgi:hypothetical protein